MTHTKIIIPLASSCTHRMHLFNPKEVAMKLLSLYRRKRQTSSADSPLLLKRVRTLVVSSCAALIITNIARYHRRFGGSGGFRPDNAPFVAIVACTKSGDDEPAKFMEQKLLTSIYKTVTMEERAQYRVELILGYDHDDEYWRQEINHHLSPKNSAGSVIFEDHEPIPVSYVSIRKDPTGDRPNRIPFNELCQAALDYGATFIVRMNDDSEFATTGWITAATSALKSFSPPNVGVVGPTCKQGNQQIMTHDMVHAPTHLSIFDTYYPKEFDNYYVDDWITRVYGKERTMHIKDWEVVHHYQVFWQWSVSQRYKPTYNQDKLLDNLVMEGAEKLERFLSEMERLNTNGMLSDGYSMIPLDKLQILGTDAIERVDGPMRKKHLSMMVKLSSRV